MILDDNTLLTGQDNDTAKKRISEIEKQREELEQEKRALITGIRRNDIENNPAITERALFIIEYITALQTGNYKTRADLANRLSSLSAAIRADRSINFNEDPWESLGEEANRPEGITLPESWKTVGVKMPVGIPTILGAYSGVGKSRTMLNLVRDAIKNKRKCLVFSLEMTPGQLLATLAAIDIYLDTGESANIGHILGRRRNGNGDLKSTINEIGKYLTVIDAGGWNASQLIETYEYFCDEKGEPDQVFIDYLQIIKPETVSRGNDRRLQVIETMDILTEKAKRTLATWLIVAQTNREAHKQNGDKRAPDHSSFQESASIEQNAGLTITLARAEMDAQLNINVSKNRFGTLARGVLNIDPGSGAIISGNRAE